MVDFSFGSITSSCWEEVVSPWSPSEERCTTRRIEIRNGCRLQPFFAFWSPAEKLKPSGLLLNCTMVTHHGPLKWYKGLLAQLARAIICHDQRVPSFLSSYLLPQVTVWTIFVIEVKIRLGSPAYLPRFKLLNIWGEYRAFSSPLRSALNLPHLNAMCFSFI